MRGPRGFGKAATDFLAALEENNSREFWQANKAIFEAEVQGPMAALIDALPARFQPFKVFRMNRDVRFSADKSPYKTMHGAVHGEDGSVHYLHVDADGLLAACGAYLMSSAQLDRYRRAVADEETGPELERVLAGVTEAGLEVGVGGAEPLKTAPRGYPKDHARIRLLRQKGVIASATLAGAKLRNGDRVRQFVVDTFTAADPLHRWLGRHVGNDPAEGDAPPSGRRSA